MVDVIIYKTLSIGLKKPKVIHFEVGGRRRRDDHICAGYLLHLIPMIGQEQGRVLPGFEKSVDPRSSLFLLINMVRAAIDNQLALRGEGERQLMRPGKQGHLPVD